MVTVVNQSGSRWEQYVDNIMEGVHARVDRFEQYTQSDEGTYRIAQVEMIAKFAAVAILAFSAPLAVAVSACIGTVVKSFSGEQLEEIQEASARISANLPTGVKMLAIVITFTSAPILFPITAGLYLGSEIGARVSPKLLAKKMDDAASFVGGRRQGDLELPVAR